MEMKGQSKYDTTYEEKNSLLRRHRELHWAAPQRQRLRLVASWLLIVTIFRVVDGSWRDDFMTAYDVFIGRMKLRSTVHVIHGWVHEIMTRVKFWTLEGKDCMIPTWKPQSTRVDLIEIIEREWKDISILKRGSCKLRTVSIPMARAGR